MKILFFVRRFYPEIGGVETHVMEVSKRLLRIGHEVTVVAEKPERHPAETRVELPEGLKVVHIPVGKGERQKKFTIWKWLWEHRNMIEGADIVHCHDVFFWYLPFRLLYPSKKVYTTFHGYETLFPPEKKAIRMRRISERLSRGNICVGDFIKKWYGTHPSSVTFGGVEVTKEASPEVLQPDKKLHILFIGRVALDMGVDRYAALLNLLRINQVDFSCKILGEGPLIHELERFGEAKGVVPEVTSYIDRSDIVFASSYLSILQALAAGKLIIAFYTNELKKDYLMMTPFARFCIIEKSPDEAYKKIKYFILNPNRLKTKLAEGQAWARTQSWDAVTELYLALWKR